MSVVKNNTVDHMDLRHKGIFLGNFPPPALSVIVSRDRNSSDKVECSTVQKLLPHQSRLMMDPSLTRSRR